MPYKEGKLTKPKLFKALENLILEIKTANEELKLDLDRKFRVNFIYGIFLSQELQNAIDSIDKDRSDKKIFSYLSDIALQTSKSNAGHWKFMRYYFSWLRKDPNLAFWTKENKQFMNKMLRSPIVLFNSLFKQKRGLDTEFYEKNEPTFLTHLELIY
jgi:hypothetical protein